MGEPYIRSQNAKPVRFSTAYHSTVPAGQRGVVNEGAFLVFEDAVKRSKHPMAFSHTEVTGLLRQAAEFVATLRQSPSLFPDDISVDVQLDAVRVAEKLYKFFMTERCGLLLRPTFPGCGWLNDAQGDILCGHTLYEVKAGERHFRLADIRQVFCYCALDFSSKRDRIREVAVINPRAGTIIREDIDSLCRKVSGTGSADVLGEIVDYISEPMTRY